MGIKMNKIIFILGIIFLMIFPSVSAIVINEIMYNPTPTSDSYNEWIEIYNDGASTLNLDNWTIDGKNFESISISTGEYLVIARKLIDGTSSNPDSFESVWGNDDGVWNSNDGYNAVDGNFGYGLNNGGDTIILKDNNGVIKDSVTYSNDFANGDGKSLQLCGSSWIEADPTPGSVNSCPASGGQQSNNETTGTSSQTSSSKNSQKETTQTNSSNADSSIESNFQTTSNGNIIKEEPEIIILNTNPDTKDIKSEETTKKLDKSDYTKYGLIGFGLLLVLLFLLKGKIGRKEYKNEFKG